MVWLAAGCALLALPGLLGRRLVPWAARLTAALALAALLVAVLDPQQTTEVEVQPGVVIVPTSGLASGVTEVLAETLAPAPVAVRVGTGSVVQRAAAAWLAAGVAAEPPRLAVLWDAPFGLEPATLQLPPAGSDGWTATAPATLDPGALTLRPLVPAEAKRPAVLELRLPGLHPGLTGSVKVWGPDAAVVECALDPAGLAAGEPVRCEFEPTSAGRLDVEVQLASGAQRLNARTSLVVQPAQSVLVIGRDAAALVTALAVQGLDAEPRTSLPSDLSGAAVVALLDPVPVAEQQRLVDFVQDGGGVLVMARADGGALPAPNELLHELLPVRCPPPEAKPPMGPESTAPGDNPAAKPEETPPPDPPPPDPPASEPPPAGDTSGAELLPGAEVEVERRLVAMVLVVDRSGSMGEWVVSGRSKMDYAKTSAYETARALREGDQLGVVTFGINGQVVLPMTSAVEQRTIHDLLAGLRATDDRTLLADALIKARRLLAPVKAAAKHIVVVSDGEIHDADLAAPLGAAAALADGITVSVIQVAGANTPAEASAGIAKRGGGVFRRTTDPAEMPRLVSAEVVATLGQVGRAPPDGSRPTSADAAPSPTVPPPEPVAEPPAPVTPPPADPLPSPQAAEPTPPPEPIELPVVTVVESPWLAPQDVPWPSVGGIVKVEARGDAQVLLVARQGDRGVPLLAWAHRGLGRVATWSSDWLGPWGEAWRQDSHAAARLAQWIAALRPPLAADGLQPLALQTELQPPAPTPRECAALEQLAGSPLAALASASRPTVERRHTTRSSAARFAGLGAGLLGLVALVEYAVARRRADRGVKAAG